MLNCAPTGVLFCPPPPLMNEIWLPLLRFALEAPEAAIIYYLDMVRLIEFMDRELFLALPVWVVVTPPVVEFCPLYSVFNFWKACLCDFSLLKLCFEFAASILALFVSMVVCSCVILLRRSSSCLSYFSFCWAI